ncbi:24324_t:CDS:2 [Gigaspora margarita]|uniref:24324_t:CDS:1 n=1 Tax=Gigaspora margarita TaxID=4874 RepID=A0ABM8W0J4_GIGMA|nr:24324_t:CDS:2 [Gigaspora margarita]
MALHGESDNFLNRMLFLSFLELWEDNGLIKAQLDDEYQTRIDNFANPATPTKAG